MYLLFAVCKVKVHRVHAGEREANKGQTQPREAMLSTGQVWGGEQTLLRVPLCLKLIKVGRVVWCGHVRDVGGRGWQGEWKEGTVHVYTWQFIFLRKSDCLGCAVLCCFALFACLTLFASFFPPSHLSLTHVHEPQLP